jgi:DNA polymerase-3 subunit alpha
MCNSCETFVNLHLHTAYSLLDGMTRPEDVIAKVKKNNQRAFAVTEHGNVYSSVRMHKLAQKNSLKYIYGCEFYICDNRFEKDKTKKYYHLTILAKDEQGRLNINKLITLANLEGFYFKPRIDFDLLSQYKDGLIVMSGCMASELQQALAGGKIGDGDVDITSGNIERAKEVAIRYEAVFGDNYYLEVQSHRDSRQQQLNRVIVDIAKELGIQWVATADSHFANEEDLDLHRIFIAINRNKDTYESDETYQDTQIQTEKEAWTLLTSLTEEERDVAIRNTAIITDKCNAKIPLSAALIPNVKLPEGFNTQEDYLKHLCNQGWKERGIGTYTLEVKKKYAERLHYEFNAISEMGFTGYYLLVYGYANSVKRRGIARGSGGGSLVAYLLNIVDIDPIRYGLYFERFIDVAQLDLLREGKITREELKIPDFDLDFGTHERESVMQNIIEEHGEEHVAALGQFGYIWDKSSIKDVSRVLGIPFDVANQMTKLLEEDEIKDALADNRFSLYLTDKPVGDETKEKALERHQLYTKMLYYAEKLAGLPRSFGMHPCGKVVTIDKTTYYSALSFNDGQAVLQGDMKDAESLGLVKIDMLGLRTVDVIYDTLDMIGKDAEYIRSNKINFEDEKVLEIFRQGWTDGIFQFESDGMKSTLKKMKPSGKSGLDDLSVVNALYRPGSMKFIDNYIRRKFGMEDFEYLHPDLQSILEISYAIIVFQEQLIEIGRNAGMRNADLLRQATGKKNPELLAKVKPELQELLLNRGWTEEQFEELWTIMLEFAKYSFNKAHSQAYAIIAYICAMLKTYHPVEFMCAWFNSLIGHHDKLEVAYKEFKRLGIEFNPLSFRNPSPICKVEYGKITYGLTLIKHCNRDIAEDLTLFSSNKYKYFVDLLIDIKERTSINSKQLDILIKLGMFSEFGENKRLLEIVETFSGSKIKYDKKHKDKTKEKRIAALHEFEESFNSHSTLTPLQQINVEMEYYGFIKSIYPHIDKRVVAILSVDKKYTPKATSYRFNDGEMFEFKIYKNDFFGKKDKDAFVAGDMIKVLELTKREKQKKSDDGKWVGTGEEEWILKKCSLVTEEKLSLQM